MSVDEAQALKDLQASLGTVESGVEHVSEQVDEQSTTEEVQLTDFEKEQQTKGWNPAGEKSAEEWLAAQPLYDEIKRRGKEIKQLRRTMDSLKVMVERAEQVAYDKALAELSATREQAEKRGDTNMVQQIDAHVEKMAPAVLEEQPEAVMDFVERNNEWLNGTSYEHMKMAEFAKRRDIELGTRNLGPELHMQTLEEHVKKEFPEYFGEEKTKHKQAVESGQGSGIAKKGKKVYTINDLSPEQKKVVYDFERNGIMTRDKYIQVLADAGEIE